MHTIVWRNKNDLDSISLDDLYNHLKVYEAEVQKKSNSNSQDMAFISSSKNSNNEDGNTVCVTTASTAFPTSSVNVATISQDIASAYIASQSNGSQIKFEDINQIDEDDMEEMDIKWNMALLSMRMDHYAREYRAPKSQERGSKESYRQGSKAEENSSKVLMAIDGVGWDWSYMENEEDHALVADREAPIEFALMANTESKVFDNSLCLNEYKELEELKLEKDGLDGKLAGLIKASKNLDHLIESQRPDQVKEGVGYNAVPAAAADLYLSPKKDLSWTGLPEFVDDTVTDYSRPSPTISSTSEEGQNKDSFTSENVASPNPPKPFVKFVKPKDSQLESKSKEQETPKKSQVKYAKQYRHSNQKPKVKGNKRIWNNLKSYQLGPEFVLNKKACYNYGDFSHLANDCRRRVQKETIRSGDHRPHGAPMRPPLRSSIHRPHEASMRPSHRSAGYRPHGPSINPRRPTMNVKTPYRAPWVHTVNRNNPPVDRKFSPGRRNFPTANRKFPTASRKFTTGSTKNHTTDVGRKGNAGSSLYNIDDKGYWDSGCSRHTTGNISYLSDFEPFNGGYVSFGQGGCKITSKGTIKTGKLKTPRQHNMYSIDLNNIVPHKDLTCLVAKASVNECILWHRRLGHLNVKTMNKLVRHNLVRGLSTKSFNNDHTCTACLKGKQHKASCKSKLVNSVTKPLHTLHMDLFGPTSVSSINHKWYCLVVTDDFSRFTWTFFLRSKDETSDILQKFITKIENLKDYRVKIIRSDNGGEFRNKEMNDFCTQKGIKREFSNARTLQQNGVAERRKKTLIEAARTMLADAKLPNVWTLVDCPKGVRPIGTKWVLKNKKDERGIVVRNKARLVAQGHTQEEGIDYDEVFAPVARIEAIRLFLAYASFMGFTKEDCIFLSPDKYIGDILKKFGFSYVRSSNTPMDKENPWGKDGTGKDVELHLYRSMIRSLMYLTSSRPDIIKARLISKRVANQEETPSLDSILSLTNRFEDILRVTTSSDEAIGVEADVSNMETTISASPTPTLRIHKDHPKSQIIGPVDTPIQTRHKSKMIEEQSFIGVRPIGTKWVLKNKKDERGIVVRNKARLVAQGHTQEEWIDYDEVFAPVARIEAIRLFLAYASFMGFTVYQMDAKSAFLYGTIDEEVYVMQPPGFQDPAYPAKLRREFKALMHEKFQMSAMGELNFFLGLQVLQKEDGIFLSQDKYIGDILKKFGFLDVRSSNTPMDKENPWGKDGAGKDVELHLYRSMIVSLMYLTTSRPDIMFAVCACAMHQVTPKECHLHAVKRIFRYLKGHPKLWLWYPKASPFDLVAYSDSDYGGAS
nr:hypothetical protein [Tanacetum cinerariifolium]